MDGEAVNFVFFLEEKKFQDIPGNEHPIDAGQQIFRGCQEEKTNIFIMKKVNTHTQNEKLVKNKLKSQSFCQNLWNVHFIYYTTHKK